MATYPPDLEAYVQQKISTGEFGSREELAIEAVRLYREIERKRAQLKSDVQAAIDEADRGLCEPLDIEAIKAELRAGLDSQGRPK
jgi:Arc/MetJ-type ribon-helix-helix transcriptional regulator